VFFFFTASKQAVGAHSSSYPMGVSTFSKDKCKAVKLVTHLQLMLRLRMHELIFYSKHTFKEWCLIIGANLPFFTSSCSNECVLILQPAVDVCSRNVNNKHNNTTKKKRAASYECNCKRPDLFTKVR
jgi:hypothetical protein